MLTFQLEGLNKCSCEGETVVARKGSAISRMARHLVAMGFSPDEPIEVKRGDTVCFRGTTLGYWNVWTTRETDETALKKVKYVALGSNESLDF